MSQGNLLRSMDARVNGAPINKAEPLAGHRLSADDRSQPAILQSH